MKARAYYYKWKFLWISWVRYADEVKNLIIESDRIGYFRLSLSKKKAFKKLKEFCEGRYG